MDITRAVAVATRRGRGEWFTGTVWQDPIVEAPEPARVKAVRVTFEPGARTAWHTHPLGQTLHVVAGVGRVQTMERPGRGDPPRRHGLDPAGREALAWRVADERARPPRPARAPERRPRDLARARDRRAIRRRADGLTGPLRDGA